MKHQKYEKQIQDELDLHGCYVDEGIEELQVFLDHAKAKGLKIVRIITGKGSHSMGAETPLRDAVINYLTDRYIWSFDKSIIGPNTGAIVIKIQ
jgi:DNA-nicking Smr family endonuclease